LLARVRASLPDDFPVLSAGGIADAADVRARLDAGAEAVVCGTRFVMTNESGAHPDYKAWLVAAKETILTELFGLGWPAPHRVVPNAATARWLTGDPRGPAWVRLMNRAAVPMLSHGPASMQFRLADRFAATQKPNRPIFGPGAALAHGAQSLVDAGALYAGESVIRITDIKPAADIVRELASNPG
jgi:NAD(P)H-dependent flavin oxidoreductase YrpB (nitropropane dioxygenase family)